MYQDIQQFVDHLKQPPDQLEMFNDSERQLYSKLMISILEHSDEIHRMHDVMQKVLAGEPGYAAKPKQRAKRLPTK